MRKAILAITSGCRRTNVNKTNGIPVTHIFGHTARAACDRRSADRAGGLVYGLLNGRSVGNKSSAIINAIDELHFDVLLLTESWHTAHDDDALRSCVPPKDLVRLIYG